MKKIENNDNFEDYDINNNIHYLNENEESKIEENEISNEQLELPTYDEVIDVNLEQLIQSLV